jgi:hypothetical protein
VRAALGIEIRLLQDRARHLCGGFSAGTHPRIAAHVQARTDAGQVELPAGTTRGVWARGDGHGALAELQVEEQRVRICTPEADLPGDRNCVSSLVSSHVASKGGDELVLYCGKRSRITMSRSSAEVVAPVSIAIIVSRRSKLQTYECV